MKYRDKKTGRVYEPNSSGWIEIKTDYGIRKVYINVNTEDFHKYFEEVPELNGAQDFVPPYNKEPNYHQQFEDCKYALRNIKKLLEEAEKRVGDFNAQ